METLFETARVRVRQLDAGDLDLMCSVYGDPDAMRYVDDGSTITREDAEAWIEVTQRNYQTRGYGMSAVEGPEGAGVIGFCGLVHPGGQEEPEVKYAFLREWWGRGIATEVVAGMLEHGVRTHGMDSVIATLSPLNHASRRVLEKCGMRPSGNLANDDGTVTLVMSWEPGPGT